jgi:hypothetical protein
MSYKKTTLPGVEKPDCSCLLRCALKANACFSLLSALILLCAAAPISTTIGGIRSGDLRNVSVALLLYCVFLWKTSQRAIITGLSAWPFVVLDLGWVLGSGAAIAFADLTVTGKWVVGITADFVLAFAVAQLVGILRLKTRPDREATLPIG